jgi:purine nucleoside permease
MECPKAGPNFTPFEQPPASRLEIAGSDGIDPVNAAQSLAAPFNRPAIRRPLPNQIDQRQATAHWTIGSAAAH